MAQIRAALNAHKALVFRNANIRTDEDQVRFASRFGPLTKAHPTVASVDGKPAVLPVDSENGSANNWHTDVTFVVNPPQASTLRSITLPAYGGETLIASSAGAYQDLPDELRNFADTLWAIHTNDYDYSVPKNLEHANADERRKEFTRIHFESAHPVVRVHPLTGERGLFIGGFAQRLRIVGLSNTESKDILRLLQAYVTRPENVVRVNWEPDQLVLFDNRITQHYAPDNYDGQPRQLNRVTIAGDVPRGVDGRSSTSIKGDSSAYSETVVVPELPAALETAGVQRVSAQGSGPRQLHLNAFLMSTGHHEASWRLPESNSFAGTDVQHFQRLAQTAERGKLDSIFFADSPVLHGNVAQRPYASLEPTVLLAAIAAVTERIGLIATASTTYNEPYNLARRFASVDHISGGRAGWNVVTTAGDAAARNFSLAGQPAHSQRYERAAEFLDVAQEALGQLGRRRRGGGQGRRRVGGQFPRASRSTMKGRHFQVEGALDVPRSAQGHPVIVQAGSSENGKDFAARYAEAVFTAHQTLADAQDFYADLKKRTTAAGRDPQSIKILPGIVPVIAATEAEALKLERELDELILPEHAAGSSPTCCGFT